MTEDAPKAAPAAASGERGPVPAARRWYVWLPDLARTGIASSGALSPLQRIVWRSTSKHAFAGAPSNRNAVTNRAKTWWVVEQGAAAR